MENKATFDSHPTEELLEEYCFHRLPGVTTAEVEEHLLVCTSCQETLQNLDEFIQLMKEAARGYNLTPLPDSRGPADAAWNQAHMVMMRLSGVWNTIWVVGLGLLCGMALASWRIQSAPLTATVPVVVLQNGDDVSTTRAPAGRPLDLAIDSIDLPPSNLFYLEIVNAAGRQVYSNVAETANGKISARAPSDLPPGVYWVRLYSGPGQLLREHPLQLE